MLKTTQGGKQLIKNIVKMIEARIRFVNLIVTMRLCEFLGMAAGRQKLQL
jgi:hypothetical protein